MQLAIEQLIQGLRKQFVSGQVNQLQSCVYRKFKCDEWS